jgi:hypothetical protein
MLFNISGKKRLRQNNIGGALLLGVEVGDGWFVCFDSLRSRRWAANLWKTNMFGLLYTPSMTPMGYGEE